MTEKALTVSEIVERDSTAVQALLEHTVAVARALAARYNLTSEDAYEVASDAALVVLRRLSEQAEKSNILDVRAYARLVTRNIILSRRRQEQFRASESIESDDEASSQVVPEEVRAHLMEALLKLDDGTRLIVTLRLIDGLTFHEIADRLKVAEATVRRRYVVALRNLKETLGQQAL